MSTNFFQQIAQLNITGSLHMIVSKGTQNNMVVTVAIDNEQCGDKAKNLIMPYNLTATPEQLDEGFFQRITTPLQTASGLMDNMEAFMKQLEEAEKQSVMEKEKAEKAKREKDVKEKRYKEAMAKADELDKEGKFREAWTKVPPTTDFPEYADDINKRRKELSDKFSQTNLFASE